MKRLEVFRELFQGNPKIAGDRFHEFGMEDGAFVIGDGDADALGISEDSMAARLTDLKEPEALNDTDRLVSGETRQPPTHTVSSRVVTLMVSGEGRIWRVALRSSR